MGLEVFDEFLPWFQGNRSYVYILYLEADNFYVGMSKYPLRRIGEHFSNDDSTSRWVSRYPPKNIVTIKTVPYSKNPHKFENKVTIKLMDFLDIDSVRGGYLISLSLGREYRQSAQEKIEKIKSPLSEEIQGRIKKLIKGGTFSYG